MSKWVCQCYAVNHVLDWVCHNCKKEWIIETSPYSNIKTTTASKTEDDRDDRKYILSRLEHYKKLATQFVQTNIMLEARNKALEAKLSLAEDLITHPYWATREWEIPPSLMQRRKNLVTALYEEEL